MDTPLNATEEIMSLRAVRQIVYDHLRRAILDGTLAAGERIVERDFAARFGASRTPVREALRQLESEDLVEHIPRKGVVVKGVALEEMEEIHTLLEYSELKKSEKFTPALYVENDGIWEGGSTSQFTPVMKFKLWERFSETGLEVAESMEVNGKRTFGYDIPIFYKRA